MPTIFTPTANVEKMRAGIPLTDDDRWPWLKALRQAIEDWQAAGESRVIRLFGPEGRLSRPAVARQRRRICLSQGQCRDDCHSAQGPQGPLHEPPTLLASQFAALEEPAGAIVVDIAPPPAAHRRSDHGPTGHTRGRSGKETHMTVRSIIADVTERIERRSRASRTAYLDDMERARDAIRAAGPARRHLPLLQPGPRLCRLSGRRQATARRWRGNQSRHRHHLQRHAVGAPAL